MKNSNHHPKAKKRKSKERNTMSKRTKLALHEVNAPGSKVVKRFYKATNEERAKTIEEANAWYTQYRAEQDKAARKAESVRRTHRAMRKHPVLALIAA